MPANKAESKVDGLQIKCLTIAHGTSRRHEAKANELMPILEPCHFCFLPIARFTPYGDTYTSMRTYSSEVIASTFLRETLHDLIQGFVTHILIEQNVCINLQVRSPEIDGLRCMPHGVANY